MYNIIEKLKEDHRNISSLLKLLESQLNSLEAGEYTNFQLIADILKYFSMYIDIHHHSYENHIFELLKINDFATADMIDEISSEHEIMAQNSQEILEEITQLQGNAIFSREELVNRLKSFIEGYYSHLDKEEGNLLPLAEEKISPAEWESIYTSIEIEDDPLFGKILDKEYEELFKEIMVE